MEDTAKGFLYSWKWRLEISLTTKFCLFYAVNMSKEHQSALWAFPRLTRLREEWDSPDSSVLESSFLTAHAGLTKRARFPTAGKGEGRRWVRGVVRPEVSSLWAHAYPFPRYDPLNHMFCRLLDSFSPKKKTKITEWALSVEIGKPGREMALYPNVEGKNSQAESDNEQREFWSYRLIVCIRRQRRGFRVIAIINFRSSASHPRLIYAWWKF